MCGVLRPVILGIAAALLLAAGCVAPSDGSSGGDDASPTAPEQSESLLEIVSLESGASRVPPGGETWIECTVCDDAAEVLTYQWTATGGSFSSEPGSRMTWVAPDRTGDWIITVTVTDSAGNMATGSISVAVGANMPPVVRSLYAGSATVLAGESTLITCIAEDPEGQQLTYSWSADGGQITGAGPSVTWFAPDPPAQPTSYVIVVTVEDVHGARSTEQVRVNVDVPRGMKVFSPSPGGSWTVCSDGTTTTRTMRAGDDNDNKGYRAFWTYDLSSVRGASLVKATLEFSTGFISASKQALAEDNPFNEPRGMGPLHVHQVRYELDGLALYDPEPVTELTATGLWQPPDEIDVTEAVRNVARGAAPSDQFQVMAAFEQDSNDNMFGEYIVWSKVVLRVYYD